MRTSLIVTLVAIFVAFVATQNAEGEGTVYEAPEIQVKFNLKEDGESLSQQNKMPDDSEAHTTGMADFDQYPFFRSNRQPTKVGTWTTEPAEFDVSINIETADIWWVGKDPDYDADCEWTFYIHHNDEEISDNIESCSSNGDELVRETYNIGTTIELVAGDTFALELWYEGWEDVDIYHDNVTYDTGLNVIGSSIVFFGTEWKGSEVSIEFSEAWPTDWNTNLRADYIMIMGADGYMTDNNNAETMAGLEYTIQMTNGTVDVTSLIIKWTGVTGKGLSLMMDYTTFDHMGNMTGNGTAKTAFVTLTLEENTSGLQGDGEGLLGLPGFEMIIAIPAIAFAARRTRN